MSRTINCPLPNFLTIREAVIGAPPRPEHFPLSELRDTDYLNELREAPHLQQFLAEVQSAAAEARTTPTPALPFGLFHLFGATGDRLKYERPYFDRRRRLLALVLETAVFKTRKNLPALNDLIWELCNEYSWALPAHLPVSADDAQAGRLPPEQIVDLFSAHTAHALAETVALLNDQLDLWLQYRIRKEIERRVFRPLFYDPHHFKWEYEPINWAAVCGGCVGMAALILEDDRERLAGMIDRVISALECYIEGFDQDGGCPEGIGYWDYGFGFYTYFADTLNRFTDGRLNILTSERVRSVASFPQIVSLGDGSFINYSDAQERVTIHPGLGSYLSSHLDQPIPDLRRPSFECDPVYRWGHVTRDLVWAETGALNVPVSEGTFYLPGMAWAVDRRVFEGETMAFSAKGGQNGEPHNHNDLGHFILHLGGESLLADLGAGLYTRQYFAKERYEALHTGSHGHSVPIINSVRQGDGPEYAAVVLDYEANEEWTTFTVDLGGAYGEEARIDSFMRSFLWSADSASQSATLKLDDSFLFTTLPAELEECFISLKPPHLAADSASWSGDNASIKMSFDPELFELVLDRLKTASHSGELITVYRVRLIGRPITRSFEARFLFECKLLAGQPPHQARYEEG